MPEGGYDQRWPALHQRLGLDARDLTEPDHIRIYYRHMMKRRGADTVTLSPASIRTVDVPNRQAVALASEVAQEILGQTKLAMTTTSRLLTWTRRTPTP